MADSVPEGTLASLRSRADSKNILNLCHKAQTSCRAEVHISGYRT
jgi:hypothetical protein